MEHASVAPTGAQECDSGNHSRVPPDQGAETELF
jgi:hypothetical protein